MKLRCYVCGKRASLCQYLARREFLVMASYFRRQRSRPVCTSELNFIFFPIFQQSVQSVVIVMSNTLVCLITRMSFHVNFQQKFASSINFSSPFINDLLRHVFISPHTILFIELISFYNFIQIYRFIYFN